MPDPEDDGWEQAFENALPADDGEAPDDPEAEVEAEPSPDAEADVVKRGDTTAPEHWPAEDSAFLDSLPDDKARERVLGWRKSLEQGYQTKFEALAHERQTATEISEAIGPDVAAELQTAGLSVGQGVGRLVQAHRALKANPEQALAALAQMYGIDLGRMGGNGHDTQRMAQIEQREQQIIAHEARQASEAIEAFGKQPGREAFADQAVRQRMGHLIQSGGAADLQTAYEMVTWGNPALRQKMLAEQQAASVKGTAAQRQHEMDRAKAALTPRSRSVPAHPTAGTEAPSIVAALNAAWDEGAKR